jgi:hypothetical protein
MLATSQWSGDCVVAKTEMRTNICQSRRSANLRFLLAIALLMGAGTASDSVWAQTCPTEDPAINAAKNNYLYLYFPTAADSTFPSYDTNVSPVAAFDVSALTSGIGTTAQLINAIQTVVADDYCEFNVQVLTTTANPSTLPSPPPQRVTVGIGDDSNGTTWVRRRKLISATRSRSISRGLGGHLYNLRRRRGPSGRRCRLH